MKRPYSLLNDLMEKQPNWRHPADPGGVMAMQSKVARLMDPGGVMAMQSKVARLMDPGGVMAMQSKMARILDAGGVMAMQSKMARLAGIGALRLTIAESRKPSMETLREAVSRAQASSLGTAALAIAATFPRHAQIASETLSALAAFDLNDNGDASILKPEDQSPLVAAISELRTAIDASRLAEDIESVVERIAGKLASKAAPLWNVPNVIAFLSLLVSLAFGMSAEMRASNQESAANHSQAAANERADRLQRTLDRLVELQERTVVPNTSESADSQIVRTNTLYVVRRAVALRQRKSSRSPSLCTLSPGTVVELIERRGRRMQVRRFDPLLGREQVGWVLRKYLLRVNR